MCTVQRVHSCICCMRLLLALRCLYQGNWCTWHGDDALHKNDELFIVDKIKREIFFVWIVFCFMETSFGGGGAVCPFNLHTDSFSCTILYNSVFWKVEKIKSQSKLNRLKYIFERECWFLCLETIYLRFLCKCSQLKEIFQLQISIILHIFRGLNRRFAE